METEHRKKQTGEQPPDVGQKEKDEDDNNKHQKEEKDPKTTKEDQDTIPEKCDKDNEPTTQEMYEALDQALELAKRMDETKQKRTNTNA